MFVIELTFEDSQGEVAIENPDWEQIEKAIRDLDGNQSTLVMLAANTPTHMAIGGGADGQYIAYVTFDNQKFSSVVDLSKLDDTVRIVAGGQESDYPGKSIIDFSTALNAAKTFAENGLLDQSVHWK